MRKIEEVKYNNTINQCGKCGSNRITTQQSKFSGKHFWQWFLAVCVVGTLLGFVGGLLGAFTGAFMAIVPAIVVGVIAGFVGQGGVINLCGNCGNSWRPGE